MECLGAQAFIRVLQMRISPMWSARQRSKTRVQTKMKGWPSTRCSAETASKVAGNERSQANSIRLLGGGRKRGVEASLREGASLNPQPFLYEWNM